MKNLKDKETLLENFICDDKLKQFENSYKKFNIFDCLGLNRMEIRHSYFLKWLLDPYETHGIDDSFLKIFLKNVLINSKAEIKKLKDRYIFPSIFDIDCWDMSNTEVDREIDNIDIKIVNKTHKFVCIIENKIDSNQHDNQLLNYRELINEQYPNEENWKKLFIYLKPKKDEQIEKPYIYVDYNVVIKSIEELLQEKDKINTEIFTIINHYKTILERDIMGNDDLKANCAMLYRKHHEAIDLINQYGKPQKTICDIIDSILQNMDCIKNIKRTKDCEIMCLPSGINDETIEKLKLSNWKENNNCCVAIRFDILKWDKDVIYSEILFAPVNENKGANIINKIIEEIESNTSFRFKRPDNDWIYYNRGVKNNSDGEIMPLEEYFNLENQDDITKRMQDRVEKALGLFVKPLEEAINKIV